MSFLKNLTISKKIILLTTVGLILGVGTLSFLGMHAVNEATNDMLQDRLITAQLIASYLDESLGHALNELNSTANNLADTDDSREIQTEFQSLANSYSEQSIYTYGVFFIDGSDKVTAALYNNDNSFYFDSGTDIMLPLDKTQQGVSSLTVSSINQKPLIFLTSFRGSSGVPDQGMIAVAIDPSRSNIGDFVQPIRLGQTGYIEIIDQNGLVIARTKPGPALAPLEKSDHSGRFAALITSGKPVTGVCHTCHGQQVERKDVLAFVPLSVVKWGVVVRQSEDEALAPTRQLRTNLILFGVGLIVLALLFVFVTTRDVGRRINILRRASLRISSGDLDTPIPPAGKDEIGVLTRTFDDMRIKLKTSLDELEKKTKELTSLLAVSEIITSTMDLPGSLDAVLSKAVELIPGAEAGVLLQRDDSSRRMKLQCLVGPDDPEIAAIFRKSLSAAGDNHAENQAANELNLPDSVRSMIHDSIAADIINRQQTIGSLILFNFHGDLVFTSSDRHLLQGIASYVALAIEKNRLAVQAEESKAWQEADRLRSEFISSISHELRTPLTLIKGYSTSLLRPNTAWDNNTRGDFLRIIDAKTDELRDLIDKLLQSAKLEAGALRLEKEPVLLHRLTAKIVDEMQSRSRNHRFMINFAPEFPVVEADSRCMEQVLRNLIENAVKYSPEGGMINVTGEENDGSVVVKVSDQGVGIPSEYQDRIFQRFYRIDNALTHNAGGTGLGLSIVKGHIEAHGGKVWLESIPNKGSTFYFSLPLDHNGKGTEVQDE